MRRTIPLALAVIALAFTAGACKKKEPTPGEQLDKGLNAVKAKAGEAAEKVNETLKK